MATPAGFVGTWDGHGRELVISPDGRVKVTFSTYVNCSATVTTGCDQITGSSIHDGGHVTGPVTSVLNSTTVIVTVASSSVPSAVPIGPLRVGHDLTHHTVAAFGGGFGGVPFCGPSAPSGYCGA